MKDDTLITVLAVVGVVAVGAFLFSRRPSGPAQSTIPAGQTADAPDPSVDLFARLKGWLNPATRADGSLNVSRVHVTDPNYGKGSAPPSNPIIIRITDPD